MSNVVTRRSTPIGATAMTGGLVAGPYAAAAAEGISRSFPTGFLWGAATGGHQIEGNNTSSDYWVWGNVKPTLFRQRSGDACDGYHRFEEDISLLQSFGLNSYRFSIEWARIEPTEGNFSNAELDHYKRVIEVCHRKGIRPAVTFHHNVSPAWFAGKGGWTNPEAPKLFARYCDFVANGIAGDVEMAFTINEPQVNSVIKWMPGVSQLLAPMVSGESSPLAQMNKAAAKAIGSNHFSVLFLASDSVTPQLIEAHHQAFAAIKAARSTLPVGVALSVFDYRAVRQGSLAVEAKQEVLGRWLEAGTRSGDFIGVQNYGAVSVDSTGPIKLKDIKALTPSNAIQTSLEATLRYVHQATGKPIVISENGIDTVDDQERIRYIEGVLAGLRSALSDLGRIGADASSQQAQGQRLSSRSALLPTVNASVSENAAKIDLAVEGFNSTLFGSSLPFSFPVTSGPFHYYDLRASRQQKVFDLTAIHNFRSADHSAAAARCDVPQAREEVIFAVVGTYLQLMSTAALIEVQRVEVRYADASYKQARAQVDAGNKAPIEANRSLVELQTEQQRLRSQLGDLQKGKYMLARLTGPPLSTDIQTTEKLQALPSETALVDDLIRRSFLSRQDLRSTTDQLHAAEEARKAAAAEHLPSATVSGYYGVEGVNPNRGNGVFQASASVNLPLFDGGRIRADVLQAEAVVTQRRAELSNQRGSIELQVRNAYVDLKVAEEEVQAADSNRKLALMNLQQSQDRFAVGVADSIEFVNSQEALATANHDYVGSLFSQHVAKVALIHAIGQTTEDLADVFEGHIP